MSRTAWSVTFVSCCITAGTLAWHHWPQLVPLAPPSDPPPLALCEQMVVERLKAPSTYRRISGDVRTQARPYEAGDFVRTSIEIERMRPINQVGRWYPQDRWKKLQEEADEQASVRAGQNTLVTTVTLEYDAANAFGTPLRGGATCQWIHVGTDASSIKWQSWDTLFGSLVTDR